jgi:PhzF family phenazine biosynthesis protein
MQLPLYQVDAFTNKLFCGNPAAVVPLTQWLPEDVMQKIAEENNLSETVFFVPSKNTDTDFDIRWFTPEVEINLCGHATLATAYVLFEILKFEKAIVVFNSKSGLLKITKQVKDGKFLGVMDFPSWKPSIVTEIPNDLSKMLGGVIIKGVHKYRELIVELENEDAVKNCKPNLYLLQQLDIMVIIHAAGNTVDFVSRFFAPGSGVPEDPVTGSAHSQLIPLWSQRLGKKDLQALQVSKRGGELWCQQLNSERVTMAGNCVFYMKGEINLSV